MMIAADYATVSDNHYVEDETVGARINGAAIRAALQSALTKNVGLFHVHVHGHSGVPKPSRTDLIESRKFVPDFFNAAPLMPHGTLILSNDSAFGNCWLSKDADPQTIDRIEFVGSPFKIVDVLA